MDSIKDIITNVGFPIACVIGLGWYVKYITDKHSKATELLINKHESEVTNFKGGMNNGRAYYTS